MKFYNTAALAAAAISFGMTSAAHAQLRELTTDRPDQTESPISVDKGHYQLEMDFLNVTRDRERDGGLWTCAPPTRRSRRSISNTV